MPTPNNRAVVLWTGGKDCNLALHEARKKGYEIISLITFAMGHARFRAHPIHVMKQQAVALGIPHAIIPVSEPYEKSYEDAISAIKTTYAIDTIVTGDIAEVHGTTNWITERSKPSGIHVYLPLWHLEREQILLRLFSLNFSIIFSCVKHPWFTPDWLGRKLNEQVLAELKNMHHYNGLDICGEQGEFHTLVLDGPDYTSRLSIDAFTSRHKDTIIHMEIEELSLKEKDMAITQKLS